MECQDFTSEASSYLKRLYEAYDSLSYDQINSFMNTLLEAYDDNRKIYIFGNGGSSATASHYAVDFNKGVSIHLDKKFNFVCLNDNIPTIMAIANDCGFENVFSMQLEGKLEKGDIILAISGSGNSKNVVKAAQYAKSQGNKVLSLTGYSGGELLKLSDYPIHVNVNDMQISEDVHMMLCHLISSTIARKFGHPMC